VNTDGVTPAKRKKEKKRRGKIFGKHFGKKNEVLLD
jgi:hypothetical protein